MIVEQITAKGRFCAFSTRDLILLRCKLFAPFFVSFLNFGYLDGLGQCSVGADESHGNALTR
jgi:hypothetical protein